MITKEKTQEVTEHITETISVDDIIGEIELLQKIEIAKKQIEDGESFTEEEVDKIIAEWPSE